MSGPGAVGAAPALPTDFEGVDEMAHRTCSIEGCPSPVYCRGWCERHYTRWRRHGDPTTYLYTNEPAVRPAKGCNVEGCSTHAATLGLCVKHFGRLNRRGTTDERRPPSVNERFWLKVNKTDACWLWTAQRSDDGYGRFDWQGGQLAHRFAYELLVGPIPEGHHLHHECENKPCVNPDHLTPLTPLEHRRRHAA